MSDEWYGPCGLLALAARRGKGTGESLSQEHLPLRVNGICTQECEWWVFPLTSRRHRKEVSMPTPKHGLGLKPDRYDPRDMIFEATPRHFIAAVPPCVDLRNLCSPVRDQGHQGSCTGFAMGSGLREFLENKSHNPSPMAVLSPAFIYYEERKMEHTTDEDAGARIRDGMKVLAKMGVCPEEDERYNKDVFTQPPSAKAVGDAKPFRIKAYHRVTTLQGLKHAVAQTTGAVLGIAV